ncbi:helix-turn-helix domain-containing protein [uncultured Bacteroides sp.]|uniref:helix-turn-helix domain-containing protein n=1 Tax=uncultured Bacteroides sp. TaxID=162156 RepID=UPI0037496AC4
MHQVKEYAYKLRISMGRLTKSVLNITGQQPSEIINNRIILKAKRMLHFSLEMNIKQIARELGFVDSSSFVKFFKRHVDISPSDFRELKNKECAEL